MADFKERFSELRTGFGKSKAEIAAELNVSKAVVTYWENGRRMPSREMLEAIADLFNVDMDYLMGRDNVITRLVSKEEMMIINAYRAASTDIKNATCAVLGVKRDPGIEQDADYLGA